MLTKYLNKRTGFSAAIVAVVIFVSVLFFFMRSSNVVIKTASDVTYTFDVEVVNTPEDMAKGLMFRKSVPDNKGMLFEFVESKVRIFWMKNTLIPLDIIFIDKDGVIQKIHRMAQPQSLMPISSNVPVLYALEINGGFADALKIKEQDTVELVSGLSFPIK